MIMCGPCNTKTDMLYYVNNCQINVFIYTSILEKISLDKSLCQDSLVSSHFHTPRVASLTHYWQVALPIRAQSQLPSGFMKVE